MSQDSQPEISVTTGAAVASVSDHEHAQSVHSAVTNSMIQAEAQFGPSGTRQVKLMSLICALFLLSVLVGSFIAGLPHLFDSDDKNNSGTTSTGTDETPTFSWTSTPIPTFALPNTSCSIFKVSDEHSKGSITFSEFDVDVTFEWESLFNSTHDLIEFRCVSDSCKDVIHENYDKFYDISGFSIDVNGDNLNVDGTYNSSQSGSQMVIFIYLMASDGSDGEIVELVLNNDDESRLDEDLNFEWFYRMITGYIGEFWVELSLKLGATGNYGFDYTSMKFIHNFAKKFWKFELTMVENSIWNLTMLEEARIETNDIVMMNRSETMTMSNINSSSIDYNETEIEETWQYGGDAARLLLNAYDYETCPWDEPYEHCGNECFGMCGLECACWDWFWLCSSTGCGCVDDCHMHDWYCSCDSFWAFWCVNIFWVDC